MRDKLQLLPSCQRHVVIEVVKRLAHVTNNLPTKVCQSLTRTGFVCGVHILSSLGPPALYLEQVFGSLNNLGLWVFLLT